MSFWAYLWAVARIAERLRKTHTPSLATAMQVLSGLAFTDELEWDVPRNNREWAGVRAGAFWIGRERFVEELSGAGIGKPANLLLPDRSPVGALGDLLGTRILADLVAAPETLAPLLAADPADRELFISTFRADPENLRYEGVPLIGWDVPKHVIWFGITTDVARLQWAPEQRAASLALPLTTLPADLPLSWSPTREGFRLPRRRRILEPWRSNVARAYAGAAGFVESHVVVAKLEQPVWRGRLGAVRGQGIIAFVDTAEQWQDTLHHVRRVSTEVPLQFAIVLFPTNELEIAADVHAFHASTHRPVTFFTGGPEWFHEVARYFPWLWSPSDDAELPSVTGSDPGHLLRAICFLAYFHEFGPETGVATLRSCAAALRPSLRIDEALRALREQGIVGEAPTDLHVQPFTGHAPTASPLSALFVEVEEWVLRHLQHFAHSQVLLNQLLHYHTRQDDSFGVVPQLGRALRIARMLLDRDQDDLEAAFAVARLSLQVEPPAVSLRVLDGLLAAYPLLAERLRNLALDLSYAALAQREHERFAAIIAWPSLDEGQEWRPWLSATLATQTDDEALIVLGALVRRGWADRAAKDLGATGHRDVERMLRLTERLMVEDPLLAQHATALTTTVRC